MEVLTFVNNCPVTVSTSSTSEDPSGRLLAPSIRYFEKKSVPNLKRQKADFAEFTAERENDVGVA